MIRASKGAPAAHPGEPMAMVVPSPDPGERTSSAHLALVDEAAAPVEEADVAGVELRPALPSDQRLELRPGDVAGVLAGLPPSARAEVTDIGRFSRAYEQAATTNTTRRLYLNRFTLFLSWCAA